MATDSYQTPTQYFADGTPVPSNPDVPSDYTPYAVRGIEAIKQLRAEYPFLAGKEEAGPLPHPGQLPGVGIDTVLADADWVKGTMAGARAVEWGRVVRAQMTPEEVASRRQAERDDDQPRYGFLL